MSGSTARSGRGRQARPNSLLVLARGILQQAAKGDELTVSASELATAARAAHELANKLAAQSYVTPEELRLLWTQPGYDTAAFLALLSLTLRRSTAFPSGDGANSAYANIRGDMFRQFSAFQSNDSLSAGLSKEVLGPALLRTDVLQCQSRLLAEAAEQLQPAAAALLSAQSYDAEDASANAHPLPKGGAQSRGQHAGPSSQGHRQPRRRSLVYLLAETVYVISTLGLGLLDGPSPGLKPTTDGNSSSSSRQSGNPMRHARAHVHSSWVLEHWARVLLLGTAPALAGGNNNNSEQQSEAQALQMEYLTWLCTFYNSYRGFDWSDFLRRPCGCALAATHMAHLCAALDGGHAFGLPRPAVLVLPTCSPGARDYLWRVDPAAAASDAVEAAQGRLVGLRTALCTLRAWVMLLGEDVQQAHSSGAGAAGPGAGAGAGAAGAKAARAGTGGAGAGAERSAGPAGLDADAGQSGSGSSEGSGDASASQEPGPSCGVGTAGTAAAGMRFLPPLSRSATFALCLRLAKGLLARWGREVPYGKLAGPGGATPLLPKVAGSTVLYHALECARLALLPDIRGRERVPRRKRAQLREWWETYVAAAQHPEALLVAMSVSLDYPDWAKKQTGVPAQLSADTAAALDAGLLPCMTRQVTRMGADRNFGGAAWCPPDWFPGADSCLTQLVMYGPLGQVGELLSALARRLRLALGELQAVVAGRRRGGKSNGCIAELAHTAQQCTSGVVHNLCVGAEHVLQACSNPGGEDAGRVATVAERLSVVAAELLPVLSHGVRVCTEVAGRRYGRARGGEHREEVWGGDGDEDGSVAAALRVVYDCGPECAWSTLDMALMLLAKHCELGERDTPWRQLLLREVRLMELLGACVEVHAQGEGSADAQGSSGSGRQWWDRFKDGLARALPLAAAAFPAEFRAAVGGAGADAAAAVAAGPSSSAGTGGGNAPCISLPDMRAALQEVPPDLWPIEPLRVVTRTLEGEELEGKHVSDLSWMYCLSGRGSQSTVEATAWLLSAMLPPSEARNAVVAAVAAEAAAAAATAGGPASGQ